MKRCEYELDAPRCKTHNRSIVQCLEYANDRLMTAEKLAAGVRLAMERGEELQKRDALLAGFAEAVGKFQKMFAARAAEVLLNEAAAYCARHCHDEVHERKCTYRGEAP